MHIHKLTLHRFKNHLNSEFEFSREINCLHGANGAGKTNVLDAIYFLGAGRSFFSRNDQQSIPFNEAFARFEGAFEKEEVKSEHRVVLRENGKKSIERNGSLVKKLSDFVAKIPVVIITPGDIELINGHSDERRKLIDRTISMMDSSYLKSIQRYNRLLLSRNEMLKKFAVDRRTDLLALESIDVQMAPEGDYIHARRVEFVRDLNNQVVEIYKNLSDGHEVAEVTYESSLNDCNLTELLIENRQKDLFGQRTSEGVHRDDLVLNINGHSVKKYASQGQLKTMTISIHLATYRLLSAMHNQNPILLLDDIYEKIDENRADNLMSLIASSGYGQIFITDTSEERMRKRLETITAEKKFFNIERNFN